MGQWRGPRGLPLTLSSGSERAYFSHEAMADKNQRE
jgi:hypothetical protein